MAFRSTASAASASSQRGMRPRERMALAEVLRVPLFLGSSIRLLPACPRRNGG